MFMGHFGLARSPAAKRTRSGPAAWLFVALRCWIDRHCEPVMPLADNRRLSSGTR